jgi:N-acylneuraminate cytidylyltransferase
LQSASGTLAVIPARGGSKRIPRKNIRPFCGVPLLARTIELLKLTHLFERIIVSTDDSEIAALAVQAGADVPFRRPAELSGDRTATAPVVEHSVRAMADAGFMPAFVCCVYPAAVLTRGEDFAAAYAMLRDTSCDYVFSATTFQSSIHRALRIDDAGGVSMFWPQYELTPSQELEPAFHDAGQFYWGRREAWLTGRPIFGPNSRMLVLPHYRVQDIDTLDDWKRAELIFEISRRDP